MDPHFPLGLFQTNSHLQRIMAFSGILPLSVSFCAATTPLVLYGWQSRTVSGHPGITRSISPLTSSFAHSRLPTHTHPASQTVLGQHHQKERCQFPTDSSGRNGLKNKSCHQRIHRLVPVREHSHQYPSNLFLSEQWLPLQVRALNCPPEP